MKKLRTQNTRNPFTLFKVHSSGNDFLISPPSQTVPSKSFIKNICHRKYGIGADGFIVLKKNKSQKFHFSWTFYNCDGSLPETCGNGLLSTAHLISLQKWTQKKTFCLKAHKNTVTCDILEKGKVRCEMRIKQKRRVVKVKNKSYCLVTSSVPHLLVKETNFNPKKLYEKGKMLRDSCKKKNISTNITFFKKNSSNCLQAVTFERGVENLTLACGSAALSLGYEFLLPSLKKNLQVRFPGGLLEVDFSGKTPRLYGNPVLVGKIAVFPKSKGKS